MTNKPRRDAPRASPDGPCRRPRFHLDRALTKDHENASHENASRLSSAAGARTLAGLYLAKESKLDILVNNAGAAWGAEIEAFPESGWDKVMDLNVTATFFLVQALLGALRAGASAERPAKL